MIFFLSHLNCSVYYSCSWKYSSKIDHLLVKISIRLWIVITRSRRCDFCSQNGKSRLQHTHLRIEEELGHYKIQFDNLSWTWRCVWTWILVYKVLGQRCQLYVQFTFLLIFGNPCCCLRRHDLPFVFNSSTCPTSCGTVSTSLLPCSLLQRKL